MIVDILKTRLAPLVAGILLLAACAAARAETPTFDAQGVLQRVDAAGSRLVIDGRQYHVALEVPVTIRGSYGALTMLRRGMKVAFTYEAPAGVRPHIIRVDQLPDNAPIEEH